MARRKKKKGWGVYKPLIKTARNGFGGFGKPGKGKKEKK